MSNPTLENVIRKYAPISGVPNSRGWWSTLCQVCHDHGKKGLRAAFKFEGEAVGYNCFNCGHTAVYDPDNPYIDKHGKKHYTFSENMEKTLLAFGIPESESNQIILNNLNRYAPGTKIKKVVQIEEPKPLSIPTFFYLLSEADPEDKWAEIARYYIEDRGFDPSTYPYMLAKKTTQPHLDKWLKRVIIPIFKDDDLIYYQGRDLSGKAMKKYESPAADRGRVIYGYDELHKRTDTPLFIVEGWFDAYSIGGIAIIGNSLMQEQISIINTSNRLKVYIPDRFGDGQRGANQALKLGWSVCTPDIGSCKDMNDAVLKYGKMYVMKTLMDNISKGFEAETKLQMYCR